MIEMNKKEMVQVLEEAILDNYDYDYNVGSMYNYEGILERLAEEGLLVSELESDNKEFRKLGER
jgi:hypothetical protein